MRQLHFRGRIGQELDRYYCYSVCVDTVISQKQDREDVGSLCILGLGFRTKIAASCVTSVFELCV